MLNPGQMRDLLSGPQPLQKLRALLLLGIGWLLSPLCWWNDLLINLPLAVGIGKLATLLDPGWMLPGVIAGYWLSNVVGIVLMQSGALGLVASDRPSDRKRELLIGLLTSSLYTVAVVVLVKLGVLQAPLDLIETVLSNGGAHGSAA